MISHSYKSLVILSALTIVFVILLNLRSYLFLKTFSVLQGSRFLKTLHYRDENGSIADSSPVIMEGVTIPRLSSADQSVSGVTLKFKRKTISPVVGKGHSSQNKHSTNAEGQNNAQNIWKKRENRKTNKTLKSTRQSGKAMLKSSGRNETAALDSAKEKEMTLIKSTEENKKVPLNSTKENEEMTINSPEENGKLPLNLTEESGIMMSNLAGENGKISSNFTNENGKVAYGWESLMKERFLQRRKRLRRYCQNHSTVSRRYSTLRRHLFFAKKYNLLVCLVPKAGTSTFKEHLLRIKGFSVANSTNIHTTYWSRKIHAWNLLGLKGINKEIPTATTIVMARHPLDRLVSAFRDKYNDGKTVRVSSETLGDKWRFFELAYRALRRPMPRKDFVSITFLEFLTSVLIDLKRRKPNSHWDPVYALCSPCHLEYDYILKTETYSEDLQFIASTLRIKEIKPEKKRHSSSYVNEQNTSVDASPAKDSSYYEDIPGNILRAIVSAYQRDFEMFGYVVPEEIQEKLNFTGKARKRRCDKTCA